MLLGFCDRAIRPVNFSERFRIVDNLGQRRRVVAARAAGNDFSRLVSGDDLVSLLVNREFHFCFIHALTIPQPIALVNGFVKMFEDLFCEVGMESV